MIRRAALLALQRPGGGLLQQPPHRAGAAGRDPEPLLGEPRALQRRRPAPTPPITASPSTSTPVNRTVGWPCGYVCVKAGSVDDRDARRLARDEEQRRPLPGHDRDDDVHRRDVAVGDEPLLAVDHPAAAGAPRRVVAIPEGSEPAPSSVTAYASCSSPRSAGRSQRSICASEPEASTLYALGTCHESAFVERPNCSSTRNHSTCDHPWPPCSTRVQPAVQPRGHATPP